MQLWVRLERHVGRSRCAAQVRCPVPRCNAHGHVVNPVGLIVQHINSRRLALAAVFRGKLLAALNAEGLTVPVCLPERWVVEKQERGQW